MTRITLELKLLNSHSTEKNGETRWIFEDEMGIKYSWFTMSSRILNKGSCYYVTTEVLTSVEGNFLRNPRLFKAC